MGAGGTDSAKEWLDKGQKWLFSAGKKVAAAAKEASSTIQSKLDEMEVFKSSGQHHPSFVITRSLEQHPGGCNSKNYNV